MNSCSQSIPATTTIPTKFARLYRAHVEAVDWRGTEVTAFVEAGTREAAIRKIAAAIGALEGRSPVVVEERLYNVSSAQELIAEGLSEILEWRLFESGWNGRATTYVREPLFLVDRPAELCRLWAGIPIQE